MLKNAEYRGIYPDTVQLTDGHHEGEPFVEGGTSRPTVAFTDATALGDLNGDGVDDAVVVLVESSGGSGNFRCLAAVLNQNGSPENVATQLIGDREQVQSVTIDDAEISVNALTHGPEDPMCCPTQEVTLTYRFDGEKLVKISEEKSSEETPTDEAPAALDGTQWTLVSYVDSQGETVHALSGTEITAEFTADQMAGGAGCNNYLASYQVLDNTLTLGPVGTTRKTCGEPAGIMVQEGDYLAALEAAASYQVEADALTLVDADGAPIATFTQNGEADIVDITRQWTALTETEPASQSLVSDPEDYTLVLRSDGTYRVKADCNVGSGGYTLEGNNLTLEPGPMTLAECGPESLFDLYLTKLGSVESLSVQDGRLILHLGGNAGKVVFRNTGPAGETDNEPADADITSIVWMWTETTTPTGVTSVGDPEKYTIELLPDGQLRVRADCNRGSGSYRLGDSHVSFEFGPMTLAECEQGRSAISSSRS
jgi:heat shock protein HslJ